MMYNSYTNNSVRLCPIDRPRCLERQGVSALPHAAVVTCGIGWPPEGHPHSMGVCHSVQHAPPGATQRKCSLQVIHVRWVPQSLQVPSDTLFPVHRRSSLWCCPGILHKRKEGLLRVALLPHTQDMTTLTTDILVDPPCHHQTTYVVLHTMTHSSEPLFINFFNFNLYILILFFFYLFIYLRMRMPSCCLLPPAHKHPMPPAPRFTITHGNKVEWLGWSLYVGYVPSYGGRFWDIRFKGERMAYELSLQEAMAGAWVIFGPSKTIRWPAQLPARPDFVCVSVVLQVKQEACLCVFGGWGESG
jgi:hypothetical protein